MLSVYLLVASAAVHACACALFGTLYVLRRAPEHRAFTLSCAFLAVFVAGNALFRLGDTDALREIGVRIAWGGGPLAVAAFVDFCSRLTPVLRGGTIRVAYTLATVGAVVAGVGPLIDSSDGVPPAGDSEPRLLPAAIVTAVVGLSLAVLAASALVRAARADREAKLIGGVTSVTVFVGIGAEILRWGAGVTFALQETGSAMLVCAVSVVLLQRFAATATGLAEQTAALEAATLALERTRQEQIRKGQLAALGELSASVAHEVRNPLAIVKNAISGMRRPTLGDADRATLLSIVSEETDRLARLVRDLLAFARPRRESDATTQLRPMVETAVAEVTRSKRTGASVAIDVRVPNALAVSGDPELLRLAVSNVIENAVHAMPQGGALTIDARTLGDTTPPTIEIIFRDEGEGMDSAVLEKALDPFFTTRAAGTGLGLAIVDNVVRSHGGEVTIESEPGAGTTVSIRVPLVRPPT